LDIRLQAAYTALLPLCQGFSRLASELRECGLCGDAQNYASRAANTLLEIVDSFYSRAREARGYHATWGTGLLTAFYGSKSDLSDWTALLVGRIFNGAPAGLSRLLLKGRVREGRSVGYTLFLRVLAEYIVARGLQAGRQYLYRGDTLTVIDTLVKDAAWGRLPFREVQAGVEYLGRLAEIYLSFPVKAIEERKLGLDEKLAIIEEYCGSMGADRHE